MESTTVLFNLHPGSYFAFLAEIFVISFAIEIKLLLLFKCEVHATEVIGLGVRLILVTILIILGVDSVLSLSHDYWLSIADNLILTLTHDARTWTFIL